MLLHIALLQMLPLESNLAATRQAGEEVCRRAAAAGADLALFPEMWSHGYAHPDPDDPAAVAAWAASALTPAGSYVGHFRHLAAELGMAIGLTYLEAWPGGPRNVLSLLDRRGELVLHYAKVHTCDWDRERLIGRGDSFPVATLETAAGPVKVGAMICYDREQPESARLLMLAGAELILTPNACQLERHRTGQIGARAFENMLAIATVNYAGPQYLGRSQVVDGIAFNRAGQSLPMLAAEGGAGEEIVMATLDLASLRDYRSRETWGNAYRRPGLYGPLSATEVSPPFVRPRRP